MAEIVVRSLSYADYRPGSCCRFCVPDNMESCKRYHFEPRSIANEMVRSQKPCIKWVCTLRVEPPWWYYHVSLNSILHTQDKQEVISTRGCVPGILGQPISEVRGESVTSWPTD
ncbi:unnamed protein product [Fusarium graminearum]|uniref:Chromosome 1, complete genome n=2 Tax=Gibberella zeae TaxID=5518 RepID=I1S4L6_GIBZE|nr:hypothetical protein FGSG_11784 [Fusarium graminearum PH-1]EYB22410.1 hypothetical protein FG05_11784 [Fusarium graminearum]ESU05769.1 hypothetical protein FGSG_11784 [Fusarium graminearum PH-1]CAF3550648.1 unnamed protein product [Fusarium graminearum]CAF3580554.1 unnamed protein product [Fusarium graminearum]CAG2004431.1 unnamed protein product [Fusarium graminearum]|eukprot:XP_011316254.1 hypothetical protein FGSG_11784 [Fusarium graminearum PH-1]